jgi:hypothetical protein
MQSKIIPFPFSIGFFIVFALSIISKISAKETFIPGMVLSFNCILEIFSWAVVCYLITTSNYVTLLNQRFLFKIDTNTANIGLACIFISGALHYLLNLINLIFYCKYIRKDSSYIKWLRITSNSTV